LLELIFDSRQYASAAMRSRLARELVIYLNCKHDLKLGIPYGAWKKNRTLLLSTLPSLSSSQRTVEFIMSEDNKEIKLVNEWFTNDKRYAAFEYWEWQPVVAGLTANRSDVQLDREVAILILEKKGAPFGFPITPDVNTPEKLCGWLQEEPPADYLDWGRDPRLVPGGIGAWQAIQHTATGVGMLVFNLLGRWSSAAFLSLADSMRVLLPSRHKLDILKQGVLRVCICLSVTSRWNRRAPAVYEELDTANVTASLQRTYSAIARMAAANRELPLPPPTPHAAVSRLSSFHRALFDEAARALGEAEYVPATDQADSDFDQANWIKLHHSFDSWRIGITSTPLPFDFCAVATLDDVRRYLEQHER
jgi:hypothetical protein